MADNGLRWTAEDLERLQKRRQAARTGPGVAIGSPLAQGAGQTGRTLTVTASAELGSTAKQPKYRNKRVLVDFGPTGEIVNGHLRLVWEFDSQKEADFYAECALRRKAGELEKLRLQEPYALIVQRADGSAKVVGEYFADAVFWDLKESRQRVCDVKSPGTRTEVYLLKRKIVEACHSLQIEEV